MQAYAKNLSSLLSGLKFAPILQSLSQFSFIRYIYRIINIKPMPNLMYKPIYPVDRVVSQIADTINAHLEKGEKVLWLIAGGSAIGLAVKVAEQLHRPLETLAITLTDERYGAPGHSDSNWKQLQDAGFSTDGANLFPVLIGESLAETVDSYQAMLLKNIEWADYSLALAGMGPDGHIFGIKPGSPAVSANSEAIGYKWDDYIRITPTINFISKLDEVIVYAVGEQKWPQFAKLSDNIDPAEQPAQLLKLLKEVIIFSDYKEGSK
jgi:6-phosphogluconolactonase/glucosamine-6-phosphate isomerase/deaminase